MERSGPWDEPLTPPLTADEHQSSIAGVTMTTRYDDLELSRPEPTPTEPAAAASPPQDDSPRYDDDDDFEPPRQEQTPAEPTSIAQDDSPRYDDDDFESPRPEPTPAEPVATKPEDDSPRYDDDDFDEDDFADAPEFEEEEPRPGDRVECVSIHAFEAAGEGEMSMSLGDRILVAPDDLRDPDGWCFGTMCGATAEGFVPSTYLRLAGADEEDEYEPKPDERPFEE